MNKLSLGKEKRIFQVEEMSLVFMCVSIIFISYNYTSRGPQLM